MSTRYTVGVENEDISVQLKNYPTGGPAICIAQGGDYVFVTPTNFEAFIATMHKAIGENT